MLFINANRDGYGVEQCPTTCTIQELHDYLEMLIDDDKADEPIYITNDDGYTYGNINIDYDCMDCVDAEEYIREYSRFAD